MSVTAHNLARNYFRRLGKSASSAECDTLGNCLSQIQDLGVLGALQEMWIHRSAYNAGSGATSFGVLGRANMSLVATPTWGVNGLTFNGTTQYGTATLPVGMVTGTLIAISQGDVAGQAAFASVASIVAAAGRSAAGGGTIGSILHNNLGGLSTQGYTGAVGTDQIQFATPYGINDQCFRLFAVASDVGPAMANWCDWIRTAHATPQTFTNANTMVTNAALFDNPGYSLFYKGTIAVSLAFNVALSDTVMQAIYSILRRTVASGLPWCQRVTIEGDSQANATTNGVDTDRWHNKLMLTAGNSWYGNAYRDLQATSGHTSTQRLAAYNSAVFPSRPRNTDDRSWYMLLVGINDLATDVPAATVHANILTMLGQARRDGFRTLVFTLPAHQTLSARQELERRALNERLRGSGRAVNFVVDLGARFTAWDAALYLDTVHLNPAGNTIVKDLTLAKISSPF